MMKLTFMTAFLFLIILITMSFLTFNYQMHPILIMFLIILYNITLILIMSTWKMNFMYSIIMFLIMISGLLIIFMYFASLISNTQMTPKSKMNLALFIIFNMTLMTQWKLNLPPFLHNQTKENLPLNNINDKMFLNVTDMYSFPYSSITILSMMYLLLSLFTIIKIISQSPKPLRKP